MKQKKPNKYFLNVLELLILGFLMGACGVKGKPLPPEPPIIMKKDKWVDSEKSKKEKKDNEEDPAKKNQ